MDFKRSAKSAETKIKMVQWQCKKVWHERQTCLIINKEIICIQVMRDTDLHEALVVVKYQIKESY